MDQFFLHLFSNSSQHVYPSNTKTSFIIKLPKTIELKGNYECGLVEFYHDKIIGNKSSIQEKPIVLPMSEMQNEDIVDVIKNQVNPMMFTSDYFSQFESQNFYDQDMSNSIWATYNIESRSATNFRNLDDSLSKITNSLTEEEKQIFNYVGNQRTIVRLNKNAEYPTLKELLQDYLHGFIDMYNKQKEKINNTNKKPTVKAKEIEELGERVENLMYKKAKAFINEFKALAVKTNPVGSNYVLIYTDIIEGHTVGNINNAKVLYMSERKAQAEPLVVTNIQYFPVEKKVISDISCYISNEEGEQLVFGESDPPKPTVLVLHFRKV